MIKLIPKKLSFRPPKTRSISPRIVVVVLLIASKNFSIKSNNLEMIHKNTCKFYIMILRKTNI